MVADSNGAHSHRLRYILTMSAIHHCRGYFFARKEGRKSIILMLVNLDPTPAGIVSKAFVGHERVDSDPLATSALALGHPY